jgi:acetamidase/formamidase
MAPRWYEARYELDSGQRLTTSTVPFAGSIKNGETVKIECVDWTGGQIKNNDSADDIRDVDLTKIHYLTGPFEIETAEPGDVLVVEIQDVQPLEDSPWGFTGKCYNERENRSPIVLTCSRYLL